MKMRMKPEKLTLLLVNLASIMEKADESLLPGVYKEVGAALHTDPTGLGSLTLFRSMVQTLCYPLAAYLAMRHNRAKVIALGAFLWSAATFLVALSSTFFQVAVSGGLNGIGLALVIPSIQSLVADLTDENNRGMAFGWLQLTGHVGSIIGLCSIPLASTSFMNIPGWRIAFLLVGVISVVIGIFVLLFANDPHFSDNDNKARERISHESLSSELKDLLKEAKSVMRIRSFQIIVAQGVSGSFPGSAFSFATMWLELIGFSHNQTAVLMTTYVVANSLGGLFGGKMGDILAKRLPNSGRIILSQISSFSFIHTAAILLLVLPYNPSTKFMHGLVLFITGFLRSWNAPATNNPIFAEIVPERSRTIIYALDRSFESMAASFAPFLVGILAQRVYGYKPIPKGSSDSAGIEPYSENAASPNAASPDRENAASLAKALYVAIGIPVAISCLIYSFLYCTYPRDRDRAKMQALIESEMQQLEADSSPLKEGYSELHVSDSDMLYQKERSVIEVDYEGKEIYELDESAGKSLLSR